jgi:uncharacterized Zn-finger protein
MRTFPDNHLDNTHNSPPSASSMLVRANCPSTTSSVGRAGSQAASDDADSVDLDADGHGRGGDAGDADCQRHGDSDKRHVCKTCGKGFNRPSSLKIHANKHSVAQRAFLSPLFPI